jgi:hypothetical protein
MPQPTLVPSGAGCNIDKLTSGFSSEDDSEMFLKMVGRVGLSLACDPNDGSYIVGAILPPGFSSDDAQIATEHFYNSFAEIMGAAEAYETLEGWIRMTDAGQLMGAITTQNWVVTYAATTRSGFSELIFILTPG